MQHQFDHIDALEEIGDVLEYARDVCCDNGTVRMSYHVTPLFDEPNSETTGVFAEGFSKEWLDLYEQRDFRAADPIPARVLRHGAIMTWLEAQKAEPNTPDNEEYFEAMRQHGLIHGVGVPLFGPRGRDAYASFDFERPVSEVDSEAFGIVRAVSQACHQRISVLIDRANNAVPLSERELEVLYWTARGKSVGSIAQILGLSPDTVKTYSKRIYLKLGVSDRVGAVVKALRLGLVKI